MKPAKNILSAAVVEARLAQHRHHHGAIVFNKSIILAAGHNSAFRYSRSIPNELRPLYFPGSMHAEVMACIATVYSNISFDKREMLVVRINKQEQFRNSCPCDSCMEVLAYYNFRRVWFHRDGELQHFNIKKHDHELPKMWLRNMAKPEA